MSRLRSALRAAWRTYRHIPVAIPTELIEQTPSGPQVRAVGLPAATVETSPLAVRNIKSIVRMCEWSGGRCEIVDGELRLIARGITVTALSDEDVFIFGEVFQHESYNIDFDRPAVVVDVGMNIGIASLWFAAQSNVAAVYGFEPFPVTFTHAARNFDLNPSLRGKIHPLNVGLSDRDGEIDLDFDPNMKGKSSVRGLISGYHKDPAAFTKTRVRMVAASDAVAEIAARHAGMDLFAKIDCEGAEYQILPALAAGGLLSSFRCIVIEWHWDGPAALVAILRDHGFQCVSTIGGTRTVGNVYAIRSTGP